MVVRWVNSSRHEEYLHDGIRQHGSSARRCSASIIDAHSTRKSDHAAADGQQVTAHSLRLLMYLVTMISEPILCWAAPIYLRCTATSHIHVHPIKFGHKQWVIILQVNRNLQLHCYCRPATKQRLALNKHCTNRST